MRPRQPRKRSTTANRARLAKRLEWAAGWLRGYPVERVRRDALSWCLLPEPGSTRGGELVEVDAARVVETRRAVLRIRRGFPRALPALVGAVDAWSENVQAALDRVDAAVRAHSGELSPRRPAGARGPATEQLLWALGWQPDARVATERARELLDREGRRLARIAARRAPDRRLELLLHLHCLLEAHGPDLPGALLDAFADERLDPDRLWSEPAERPAPFAALDSAIVSWVAEPKEVRAGVLRLLSRLLPLDELADPVRWSLTFGDGDPPPALAPLGAALGKLAAIARRPAMLGAALAALDHAVGPYKDLKGPAHLLLHWADLAEWREDCEAGVAATVRAGGAWLARGGPPFVRWLPWTFDYRHEGPDARVHSRGGWKHIHEECGTDMTSAHGVLQGLRDVVDDLREDIERSAEGGDPLPRAIEVFEVGCWLMREARSTEGGGRLLRAVHSAGCLEQALDIRYNLEAVVRLAAGDGEALARLVRRVAEWSKADDFYLVDELEGLDLDGPAAPFLRDVLLHAGRDTLRALVCAERFARRLEGAAELPSEPAPRERGWWDDLPPALRGVLAELEAVLPDAEAATRAALGPAFRDERSVRAELAALDRRIGEVEGEAAVHLRRRRASLRARLGSRPSLAPGRLARMRKKLAGRLARARAERRIDGVWRAALAASEGEWGREVVDLARRDPRAGRALEAVLALKPAYRNLGLKVLGRRTGAPPWELLEEAPNRAFLECLRGQGLCVEPWIEGTACEVVAADGTRLRVAIEKDPLEALFLGAHFSTCLSPQREFFWSAVVNVADVNKQVVYARDACGKVVGRQLLALTADGGLLAYHPYAHDETLGFPTLARAFAAELADAMGARQLRAGKVLALLARDWYDDGPIELRAEWAFLAPWGEFHNGLPEVAPDDLLAHLASHRPVEEWDAAALYRLLYLVSLGARGELLPPLLPALRRAGLDREACLLAARLAWLGGDRALAESFLGEVPVTRTWVRGLDWKCREVLLEVLSHLDPVRALAALRWTARRASGPEEEWDTDRRELWARAYEATHRAARAARLRARWRRVDQREYQRE